jgi:RimJ/RimL family protein N-acetyltransferase
MPPFHLETERLILEPLDAGDLAAFVEYRQSPEVARFQSWDPTYSLADAHALLALQPVSGFPELPGEWVQLAVRPRAILAEYPLAGDVAIGRDREQPDTFELGVTLAPEHRGRGYATEAVRATIDELFAARGAHRVIMQCDSRNVAVLRVIGSLGLRHEGAILEGDWFKCEWTTLERFALLYREWLTS